MTLTRVLLAVGVAGAGWLWFHRPRPITVTAGQYPEELVYARSSDDVINGGTFFSTSNRSAQGVAVIWVHGWGTNFYYPTYTMIGRALAARGLTTISVNTRMHDLGTSATHRMGRRVRGGGYWGIPSEQDLDIAAWVSFAGPHDPYDPPAEMAEMYYDAPIPAPIGSAAELATKPRAQRGGGSGSLRNSMYRIDPSRATLGIARDGLRVSGLADSVSLFAADPRDFHVPDGADGALAWHSEAPEELWVGHRERPNELLLREAGDYPPGHAEGFPDTFKHLYRAVYAAVADGGPPDQPGYPTFADGHEEALIADAVARSHAEQRWVAVDPVVAR